MECDKKLKLLFLIDSLSGGGAELVVSNLCRHLDKERLNVSVCTLKMIGERGADLLKGGYDVYALPESRYRLGRYLSSCRLSRIVRERKVDIIHSHSTQGLVDGGLVRLMNGRVRHVHTFHYGNYPHLDARSMLLERLFVRLPDRLIAVGEEQKRAIQMTFRLNGKNIRTIWNGIEIGNGDNARQRTGAGGIDHGKVIIGSISTLIEQKGIFDLLDAVAMLGQRRRDFQVWIVGDGPLRDELEAKKRSLGLEGLVEFKGWIRNAPTEILPRIDIFIQSSLWEAMSMVILEAMAAGRAVIATEVGDNGHVIDNGHNGILVKKGDVAGMAEKLESLIADDRLCRKLGQNARQRILRDCSVEQMARNHELMYRDILGL